MHSNRILCPMILCALIALAPAASQAATPGPPANVIMVAGNGQVVQANFQALTPLTILVTDAVGNPVPGVPVTWLLSCAPGDFGCNSQFTGTLTQPAQQTDAMGLASTGYSQSFVPPGQGFSQSTLTATTSVGTVTFKITAAEALSTGAPPVSAFLVRPGSNGTITGAGGSTQKGAVQANASTFGGFSGGQGIANVGLRIIDAFTRMPTPVASCNAPAGIVLSDANGSATCDLVLANMPGTYRLGADVGGGQAAPEFVLTITAGQSCVLSISPLSQSFTANGGAGAIAVTAPTGCAWSTTSSAPFVTITSGASGTGNGAVGFTVASNTAGLRSGTISIAGQIFTVNQGAIGSGPGPLTISTGSTLPAAVVGGLYSTTITATGGTGTYSWSVTPGTLPQGLVLTASQNQAVISGTPTTVGNFPFTVTVSDTAGASQQQVFTLSVGAAGSAGLTITTTTVANGAVGLAYLQPLTFTQTTSCGGPFAPPPAFTITSGSLPPGLTIQMLSTGGYAITGTPTAAGSFPFTLILSNSCGQSPPVSLVIGINGSGVSNILNVNPAILVFNATLNGAAPQPQQVAITSTGASLGVTATANVPWLALTLSPTSTPATLAVSAVNYQSLPAGVYQGAITIVDAANDVLVISVTLNLAGGGGGGPTAGLSVSASSLSFALPANSFSQQIITVLGSSTSPTVTFVASAITATGAPWLALVSGGGGAPMQTVSGTTPANLGITVNTSGLLPGRYTGSIVLQQPGTSVSLTVQIAMTVAPNSLTVDAQSLTFNFAPGTALPPQIINVTSSIPIVATVTTTTVSGGNWLSAAVSGGPGTPLVISVMVNPAGLARATYNGTVIITPQDATIPVVRVPVTLTIGAGVGPTINGVVNAASNMPGPVSPGEFITIYGTTLSSPTPALLALTPAGTIANTINGTQVLFDGIPSPLVYVSATQINAIVPYELFGRARTQLQVQFNGAQSTAVDLAVSPSAPGIFLCLACQPANQAAALNQDNTPNSTANGALPGTIVTLFATGEGQTDPPGATGTIVSTTLAQPLLPVSVRIGGLPAEITYKGSAPSLAEGVLQVNVRIPLGVPRGVSVSVTLTIGDATSNQASIAIAP